MGKTSKQLRRNKFGDPKNSRAKQYFRGSTPALAAIPHVDDPLLAILPPPPIPVVAIALPLPIAVDLRILMKTWKLKGPPTVTGSLSM